MRNVRHDDRVKAGLHFGIGCDDLYTDEATDFASRIDDRNYSCAHLHCTKDRDFGEIGFSGKHQPRETARRRLLEDVRAIALCLAKERKGVGERLNGQPGLLGKTLRRQVIGVAPRRRILDLDEALLDAALQVRVNKTERDAEFGRNSPLRTRTSRFPANSTGRE